MNTSPAAWTSFMAAYGRISKLQFFIKKILIFLAAHFCATSVYQIPGSRTGSALT
jgi:hypothetical protein